MSRYEPAIDLDAIEAIDVHVQWNPTSTGTSRSTTS